MPPCLILLTQNPLCRVPSHSSPLTQEPRLRYSRLGAFPSPSGAHYSESASARLPPPRVRCETVNQFYFSLKGFLLNIHEVYHSIYVLSIPFLYFFVKKSKLIAINLPVFEQKHQNHRTACDFGSRKCPPYSVKCKQPRKQKQCSGLEYKRSQN